MKNEFILFLVIVCNANLHSQINNESLPVNCIPKEFSGKTPVPYQYVREADVMWAKRIYRTIDLREKINIPLYYPLDEDMCRKSIFEVIKLNLLAGNITAFGKPLIDEEFKYPMTVEEVKNILISIDTIDITDITTGLQTASVIQVEIVPEDIKRYWIMEDWFFDKQRSVMEARIVAICPLREKYSQNGEFRGYEPLFWLYYNQCRPYFVKQPVLWWSQNTAAMPSMDDIFIKRIFSGFIHKESNVYGRHIIQYATGKDALLEAEKIKNELINLESDFWHY